MFEILESRRFLSAVPFTQLSPAPVAMAKAVVAAPVALPRVVGSWKGVAQTSSGVSVQVRYTIQKQTTAGVLSGIGYDSTHKTTLTLTGKVYADGRMTLRTVSNDDVIATATSKLSLANKRLIGTWSNNVHTHGTFTLNRV